MSKKVSSVAAPKDARTLNDRKKTYNKIEPYIWIAPSVILMAVFIIVPIFYVFKMSMSKITKAGQIKGFIWFENFEKVLGSAKFALVLKNTVAVRLILVFMKVMSISIPVRT